MELSQKKKIRKIIQIIAISAVFALFLLPAILSLLNLQFIDGSIKNTIDKSLIIIISIALILLIWFVEYSEKRIINLFMRVIVSILFILFCLVVLFVMSFGQRVDTILFVNTKDSTRTIEYVYYDIGATDSGSGGEIFEVDYFSTVFRYISKIDSAKIDRSIWVEPKRKDYY
jgi:hypothetical protein